MLELVRMNIKMEEGRLECRTLNVELAVVIWMMQMLKMVRLMDCIMRIFIDV